MLNSNLVVVMPDGLALMKENAGDFLLNELGRVAGFARNSLFPASSVKPLPRVGRYDLEHLVA